MAILTLISTWLLYNKANLHGWAAIIPFYTNYTMFKLIYGNGWKFLLLLIPILNIYIAIKMCFDLAKVFGKGIGFGFGLLFLDPIFIWILGLGEAKYQGTILDIE